MLPIEDPENVVRLVNRYGFVYTVVRRSLELHGDYVTFEARSKADLHPGNRVAMLREEIGSVETHRESY